MRDDHSGFIQFQGKKSPERVVPQTLDLVKSGFLEGSVFLVHQNFIWVTLNGILVELH